MTDRLPNLQTTLLALCALLGVVFLYEILAPLPALDAPAIVRPVRLPPVTAVAFSPPLAGSFEATVQRPIFSPMRKPVQPRERTIAVTELPPPDVTVLGVIIDGERKFALVRSAEFPLATSVSVGGTIGGWQVAQVSSAGVELRSGSRVDQIELNAKHKGAVSAPLRESSGKASPGP